MKTPNNTLTTPCFIFDRDEMERGIEGFASALSAYFTKSVVGYSVKTNSLPRVLETVRCGGCYAEVVSYTEYALAKNIGFAPESIIYNGPLKSEQTFAEAVLGGAMVNIETWREIEWLREVADSANRVGGVKCGIRLNINISEVSPEDAACECDDSRFGFSAETGDFLKAVETIGSIGGVTIAGIHTHREPKTRSVSFYQNVIRYAQCVIEDTDKSLLQYHQKPLSESLEYWDLGGGFFGSMPGKPTFDDYARAFHDAMQPWARQLTIVVEPGNALIASALSYVTSVIDVKRHGDKIFVTTDGSRNDIDPFFRKSSYFRTITYRSSEAEPDVNPSSAPVVSDLPQVIGGMTCLENDRLFILPSGRRRLAVGDTITYDRVGAYTMALSPLFIRYFPTVYERHAGNLMLVREEWDASRMV